MPAIVSPSAKTASKDEIEFDEEFHGEPVVIGGRNIAW
jgi:hypothetical protein